MAITDSLGKLGATLASIAHTRLELASVELEEELHRFSSTLLWSLTALFFACMAIMLAVALVVVLFWDTYRIPVIAGLAGIFAVAAVIVSTKIRTTLQNKPRLLSSTLTELQKDGAALRGETPAATESGAQHE
ncbi:phage holin family protein [Undibacterium sp. SXout7W]|uniref:phage holin family protein n=1 Tax=Undibacterium sp. SXout7W TaxID=3413049 RepID=UPI003BEFA467